MRIHWIFKGCLVFAVLLMVAHQLIAKQPKKNETADWPRFRGPKGTGISQETGLLKTWPNGGPNEIWRVPIGAGYSGISVADERLFTMGSDEESEFLICLDPANGKEQWRKKIGQLFKNSYGDGPRSTPTIDGETVYAIGAEGNLIAVKAREGEFLWSLNLKTEFEFRQPQYWWGFSMSPFIEGDKLMVQAGGSGDHSIVVLNKKNGEVIWTTHSDFQAYSTPIAIDFNNKRQFVFVTAQNVVSVSSSGDILWKYPWGGSIIKIAMPIFVAPDKIFVSAAYGIGAVLLQMISDGPSITIDEVWKSKVMSNHFHTSVLIGDYLYGFDNGTFKCIKAETGEQTWARRRLGKGSLIYADGHLIVLSERGKLLWVEANPNEYVEKSSVQVLQGRTWTPPTLANGMLFLRNQKEIVCLNLRNKKS